MNLQGLHCIAPPAPNLEQKIMRSKRRVVDGQTLPERPNGQLLDNRSFAVISNRPKRTRPDTFLSPARELAPAVGQTTALVLPVDFSDVPATRSLSEVDTMLFGDGAGSAANYFREVSYNKLNLRGDVIEARETLGWYRALGPKTHYANNNYGYGDHSPNARALVEEVIDLASQHVDFADYDRDGDGVVDALVVIASGRGAESTGNLNDLWSHKSDLQPPKSAGGVKVRSYLIASEFSRLGIMCHELGHLLFRWPDLYDVDSSSHGTGQWDLMGGGCWNGGGHRPAHPSAWCKAKAGWMETVTIFNEARNVTLSPYATSDKVYKLPVGNAASREYFLLSNRKKVRFDDRLPGEGLLIEHVDENQANNTDESHYLVDIEQADGARHLNRCVNAGDANDTFPTESNDTFTGSTEPNSKAYDGSDSNVAVTNMRRLGADIAADIAVGEAASSRWHRGVTLIEACAHHTTQSVSVKVDSIGWRRIEGGARDGTTNLFYACCEAVANGGNVDVYADGAIIYTMYLK